MVLFVLEIKADFENVSSLELHEGYSYCIDVKNSAGEDAREGVYVTSTNDEELQGSKGSCHFQVKWVRDAKSSAYLNVQETVKGVCDRKISGEKSGEWQAVVGFDCRGLEPVAFHPENGWKAVSQGGTTFEDADLREDWAEYCDKASESVGIYEFQARFVRK